VIAIFKSSQVASDAQIFKPMFLKSSYK